MSGIQHLLVNKESNWSLIHYKNILLELSSSRGRHFKMLINSCLIVTSWLVLYPHLGKAALDIGTWNELCWKMAHRQIISFERPNLWLAAIKKIGLSKYNNKPLQNTNKNKPDHSFFCWRGYKAWCVVRDRKCIFSKQSLLKTSLDRSFVNNSQQKLWLDATFHFDQYN